MEQSWSQSFGETLQGKFGCTVEFVKGISHQSKMAAVLDDKTTLSRFHAWQHSLDQAQSFKKVTSNNSLAILIGTHSNTLNITKPALLTVE